MVAERFDSALCYKLKPTNMLIVLFIILGYLMSKYTSVPKHETYSEIEAKIKTNKK